jgi:hypothetical protein
MRRRAQGGCLLLQVFLIEGPLGGYKLVNFALICVLSTAILALGIVIICKRASSISAKFNHNGCAAIQAVKCSFLFAHSTFSLSPYRCNEPLC